LTSGSPSRFAERLVWLLLPPVYREPVLGDLRERYVSPAQYFLDAVVVIPCVLVSRIRRTTDPGVLLLEALVLYLSFFTTAWYTRPASFFTAENGLARLAVPTVVSLLAFVLVDAYANPEKRLPLKPALQAALAMGFAFLSQASLVRSPELAVPFQVLLVGGAASLLLISAIRMLFDSGDRPAGAA
jgi:hypothetical protein